MPYKQQIKEHFARESQPLHHKLEAYIGKKIFRVSTKDNWPHQLGTCQQRLATEVTTGVPFEQRIGREIELCRDRLVAGSGNKVVNVLAHTIRIVTGNDALKKILASRIADKRGTVSVAIEVIVTEVIGLPDLDLGEGDDLTTDIKYLPTDRKRHPGIARCSQGRCLRCALFVERTEFVPWSRSEET